MLQSGLMGVKGTLWSFLKNTHGCSMITSSVAQRNTFSITLRYKTHVEGVMAREACRSADKHISIMYVCEAVVQVRWLVCPAPVERAGAEWKITHEYYIQSKMSTNNTHAALSTYSSEKHNLRCLPAPHTNKIRTCSSKHCSTVTHCW